ncbi:MAG: VWA domain-containing protein [bacterium]
MSLRPQSILQITDEQKSLDIMFVLDGSRSMWEFTDVAPNRLEAAKQAMLDLVKRLKTDRAGLIVFMGIAAQMIPLTDDYQYFQTNTDFINRDDLIQIFGEFAGTNMGDALLLADQHFSQEPNRSKVILLLTDGEANLGVDPVEAANILKQDQVKLYALHIGRKSAVEGFSTLNQISQITGGKAYSVEDRTSLEQIIKEIESMERSQLQQKKQYSIKYDNPGGFFPFFIFFFGSYLLIKIFRHD